MAARKTGAKADKTSGAGPKLINLALQGGGSHGAFSWGVLDRLLEDDRIEIEAVTGTSAGAMNAVALAVGYGTGDREGARATLRALWEGILRESRNSFLARSPMETMLGGWGLDASPAYVMFDLITRIASPYDFNPFNANPLRDLVVELIDFEKLRQSSVQVFVSATNVETGRSQVWGTEDLTADHVMASACLPWLFQAVEIDGVPYWDGGFTGNPPLWPLFEACESDDVVLVQINPILREGAPKTARDIINRINEITFNSALLRDLRSIDFVTRLMEAGRLDGTGYRRVLVHAIEDEQTLSELGASSKFNTEPEFIDMLFNHGRTAAETWLKSSFRHVGVKGTIDIRKMFQGHEDSLDGARIAPPRARKTSSRRKVDSADVPVPSLPEIPAAKAPRRPKAAE